MPRIRSVHPDLCEDPTLARVSASAERTFVRLWPHLDDDGRCVDRPKLLKARLYPEHDDMTPERVDEDIKELAIQGLVIRYEVDGKDYLSAKPETWAKYQHPQRKRDSTLPPIPDNARTPRVHVYEEQETGNHIARAVVVDVGGDVDVVGEGVMTPTGSASPATNGRKDIEITARYLKRLEPVLASGSSFDMLHEFRELWEPAWQEAIDQGITPTSVGRNLLATFIATVTGQVPDYGRAAQLVGRYGKLALLGIDEGLIANARDPYRYAHRVCSNQAAVHRSEV